jgi:hypothetical protein
MAEPPKTPRPRGAATRIAPRRNTADRRLRILERLTTGLSVAHIAPVEQLTARRAPQIIAHMLAGRETDPPAGFELTSELARYHGFALAQIPGAPEAAAPPHLTSPEPRSISPKSSPPRSRREIFRFATP